MRRRSLASLIVLFALAAAGCGIGAGDAPSGTRLMISRDFGERSMLDTGEPKLGGEDTVMRMLERNADVKTRYGGAFVQEIEGVAGGQRDGHAVDWFFYVNGLQSDEGDKSIRLDEGDSIWWDHHRWDVSTVDVVIGQFPQPFSGGPEGRRLPVRVECAEPEGADCKKIRDVLVEYGVPASRARLAAQLEQETLRVLVGPWQRIGGDRAAGRISEGPRESGVFARFEEDRTTLALLDSDGRARRRLGAGAGLIAATRVDDEPLVWVVTGTDDRGVASAVAAFGEASLHGNFALAITPEQTGVGLPLQ